MKKKTTSENITLDDLAAMVASGFTEQGHLIKQLESRIDARIDGVEQKLGALHGEVLSMNYDHKKMKPRLENVELRVFGSIQEA